MYEKQLLNRPLDTRFATLSYMGYEPVITYFNYINDLCYHPKIQKISKPEKVVM